MKSFPVVPIVGTVVLPNSAMPLRIGRAQSIAAVEASKQKDQLILTVLQKDDSRENPVALSNLHTVGTLAKIEKVTGNAKAGYQIFVRGISRFRVDEFKDSKGHIMATGEEWAEQTDADSATLKALLTSLKEMAKKIVQLLPGNTKHIDEIIDSTDDLSTMIYLCTAYLDADKLKKQEILETAGLKDKGLLLLELMQKQKDQLQVQSEIQNKLSQKLGQHQRETILREQLKTIREELGEDQEQKHKDDLLEKIDKAGLTPEAKKIALEEWKRLESLGPQSQESHVIRNYLELIVALPWSKSSPESEIDHLNLAKAKEILEKDHYGLDKIKKRILQHLAVMKLKKSNRGQIILFVGPPGVGKTSLGQSIAKALGRKFVRGSLGGVRDDAEIRGHRRTYVGAMPGRIIQGIKRAGENNPVFMLDEIDKLGRGFQGDPAAALLEVLDPEQNSSFLDHYLDIPFDLSKVFFIATANSLESIPGPLLDRMEVIDLSGYTTAEKLHIAKNHLIPKQWEEHGVTPEQLIISDEALQKVITGYTREAGVRDLQRKIATLCRAMAEKVLDSDQILPVKIEVSDLEEIFGGERHFSEVAERLNPPGVVTGLAWTAQGGEILFIEANQMPGKGQLILTGQLGDVMKESTQIALSIVRSRLAHMIPDFEFQTKDIHVHVPAGAIPKDGPSAGITMLTTVASLLTNRSVNPKLAMTGELTLRGAVMPVGGIKEKVIAAHRAGIEHIILSKRNQKDLKEVPEEIKKDLKFDFVESASEVLKIALDLDAINPIDTQRDLGAKGVTTNHLL